MVKCSTLRAEVADPVPGLLVAMSLGCLAFATNCRPLKRAPVVLRCLKSASFGAMKSKFILPSAVDLRASSIVNLFHHGEFTCWMPDARSHPNSSLNAVKDPFLPGQHTRRSTSSPQKAEHVTRGPSLCLNGDRHPAQPWRFSK